MPKKSCQRCADVTEVWTKIDDLNRAMDVYHSQIERALSVGMDQGRILGLLEAATALEKNGYGELSDVIRRLVDEDLVLHGSSAGEA